MSEKTNQKALDDLLQEDFRKNVIPYIGRAQWQVIYESDHDPSGGRRTVFSALLEERHLPRALEDTSWDLRIGDGLPGFSQHREEGETVTTYHRYGGDDAIRPFVLIREFDGAWPRYPEICEEFRHFHNLAHDTRRNLLLDFDQSGYEIEAVRLGTQRVEVHLRHLKQFLAATRLNIVIYVDSTRYSTLPISEVPEELCKLNHRDNTSYYQLDIHECNFKEGFETFSRLLGKFIIFSPPIEEAGVWPFEEDQDEDEVEFIIDVDDNGRPVTFTSHPNKLSNYFGANPEAPHYQYCGHFFDTATTKNQRVTELTSTQTYPHPTSEFDFIRSDFLTV